MFLTPNEVHICQLSGGFFFSSGDSLRSKEHELVLSSFIPAWPHISHMSCVRAHTRSLVAQLGSVLCYTGMTPA